ncbi:hypothetical protein ACJX0J_015987, partial [Zea mays]
CLAQEFISTEIKKKGGGGEPLACFLHIYACTTKLVWLKIEINLGRGGNMNNCAFFFIFYKNYMHRFRSKRTIVKEKTMILFSREPATRTMDAIIILVFWHKGEGSFYGYGFALSIVFSCVIFHNNIKLHVD